VADGTYCHHRKRTADEEEIDGFFGNSFSGHTSSTLMPDTSQSISHEAEQRLQSDIKRDAARTREAGYDVREHTGQDKEAIEDQLNPDEEP
jgi:hypothetical protein